MKKEQVNELLLQTLETELGGVQVYENAVQCAINGDLRKEWEECLRQTQNHVKIVRSVFEKLGLDPEQETPGRKVVRHVGESLVKAIRMAQDAGNPDAAQLVAAECVIFAETKDHLNWELIGQVAEESDGKKAEVLKAAYDEVEDEKDEHLYHTTDWCRELWIKSLGDAGGASASRGGKGSEDGHRPRSSQAVPRGDALSAGS